MKLSLAVLKMALLVCLLGAGWACPPNCSDCDSDGAVCYACDESY